MQNYIQFMDQQIWITHKVKTRNCLLSWLCMHLSGNSSELCTRALCYLTQLHFCIGGIEIEDVMFPKCFVFAHFFYACTNLQYFQTSLNMTVIRIPEPVIRTNFVVGKVKFQCKKKVRFQDPPDTLTYVLYTKHIMFKKTAYI